MSLAIEGSGEEDSGVATDPGAIDDGFDPPRPDSFYGVGKLFGENTGRLFSDMGELADLLV